MQIDAFSSEASIVNFYRIKMGHIENAERAEHGRKWRKMVAVDYFSLPYSTIFLPTDRADWHRWAEPISKYTVIIPMVRREMAVEIPKMPKGA
jgi:hypothetical protein